MVAKKKSTKSTPEIEEKEERRSPVTQVVEVVEDNDESVERAQADKPSTSADVLEDPPVEEKSEQTEESSEEEKRRDLVDELFQKKEEQPVHMAPEITMHHRSSKKRPIIGWAITMIILCLVVGGGIIAVSTSVVSLSFSKATPTPSPTSISTPTPTPDISSLDRSTLSVQVLNGSGIAGEAGRVKTLLEEKGYTVDNTGNAQTYDHETTQIFVKSESEAYLALLQEDLKESYSIGTSEATLGDDVPYDVRIIVGKE